MFNIIRQNNFYKKIIVATVGLTLSFFSAFSFATETHWEPLTAGLDYAKLRPLPGFFTGQLHAFRVDLNYFDLDLALASDHNARLLKIKDLVLKQHGLLGINGGFFSPQFLPLGLRIQNGKLKNPIKPISWWGVFYIRNGAANVVSMRQYQAASDIRFAIQSGPRLIVDGRIPALKPGIDDRSALGVNRQGQVIIVSTQNLPITTTQLAEVMRLPEQKGGLDCVNALNLDGGSSTQIYADIQHFHLNVSGYSPVADAVVVIPK